MCFYYIVLLKVAIIIVENENRHTCLPSIVKTLQTDSFTFVVFSKGNKRVYSCFHGPFGFLMYQKQYSNLFPLKLCFINKYCALK